MCAPAPFQSPLTGFGSSVADDAEVLGDAVEQPAGHPQLVGHVERAERADLELPLAGHDLGVDAGDAEAGVEARLEVRLDDVAAEDLVGADAAVVEALRGGEAVGGKPSGRPSLKNVYSCSMPNSGSWSAYFSAIGRSSARVLVACGVMSVSSTSHITSTSSPPRIGSGHDATRAAARSRSCCPAPGWCSSRRSPRSAGSLPSARILVFDRSRARRLGAVDPDVLGLVAHAASPDRRRARAPSGARTSGSRRSRGRTQPHRLRFPRRCPNVNALLTGRSGLGDRPAAVRRLLACSSSSTTSCARSRSAGSGSSASGSPTCSGS